MDTLFNWCAIVGGCVFLGQFSLSLLAGAESALDAPDLDVNLPDIDTPDLDVPDAVAPDIDIGDGAHTTIGHGTSHDMWFVGMFSLRAILAGVTVFGLTGLALPDEFSAVERMILALAMGFGTMYSMGWLVRKLQTLEHDGTVYLSDALHCTGTVYLTIPAGSTGAGKVTVTVKGRTMEYAAITNKGALLTGSPVVVTGLIPPGTVRVAALEDDATRMVQENIT